MQEYLKSYYDLLIGIGKSGKMPDSNAIIDKGLTKRIWLRDEWVSMTDQDLILLFKGLVIIEEYWFSQGDHIGSTTDTKHVYWEIQKRGLDPDVKLGDWAFQYSSNPYVPEDTGNRHGAKTLTELRAWWHSHEERAKKERDEAIIRREEKKRLKAEAHAERLRRKEERDKALGYK